MYPSLLQYGLEQLYIKCDREAIIYVVWRVSEKFIFIVLPGKVSVERIQPEAKKYTVVPYIVRKQLF